MPRDCHKGREGGRGPSVCSFVGSRGPVLEESQCNYRIPGGTAVECGRGGGSMSSAPLAFPDRPLYILPIQYSSTGPARIDQWDRQPMVDVDDKKQGKGGRGRPKEVPRIAVQSCASSAFGWAEPAASTSLHASRASSDDQRAGH
jgi:hypothetical protein